MEDSVAWEDPATDSTAAVDMVEADTAVVDTEDTADTAEAAVAADSEFLTTAVIPTRSADTDTAQATHHMVLPTTMDNRSINLTRATTQRSHTATPARTRIRAPSTPVVGSRLNGSPIREIETSSTPGSASCAISNHILFSGGRVPEFEKPSLWQLPEFGAER